MLPTIGHSRVYDGQESQCWRWNLLVKTIFYIAGMHLHVGSGTPNVILTKPHMGCRNQTVISSYLATPHSLEPLHPSFLSDVQSISLLLCMFTRE